MVGEESDRVVCVLEVMMPMVKDMDNSEDFSVVYIVVPFCRGEHLGKVHTGWRLPLSSFYMRTPPLARREALVMTMKGWHTSRR